MSDKFFRLTTQITGGLQRPAKPKLGRLSLPNFGAVLTAPPSACIAQLAGANGAAVVAIRRPRCGASQAEYSANL